MNTETKQEVEAWLRSEKEGDLVTADRAFRQVFQRLPAVPLPAGFSQRVLAEVVPLLAPRRDPFSRPLVKWSIAASFLLFGALFAGLPRIAREAGSRVEVGSVIDVLQKGTVFVSDFFTGALDLWSLAATFSSIVSSTVQAAAPRPLVFMGLVVVTLMAVLTLRLVTDLASRQKGFAHAEFV